MPDALRRYVIGGAELELLDLPAERPAAAAAPIVLLHEGLGSIGLWRGFPERLRARTGRRVVAYSRHGHGGSAPPPQPRTPAFFHTEALEVLPELLAALDVARPVLVGHSDGASIALIHAAHHPAAAVVLLAPHVFVEAATVEAIARTRDTYERGDLRGRLARHHADVDAAFRGWSGVWLDPDFRAWTLDAEAARLTAPTLLIQGESDEYASLEQLERIARAARGPVTRLVVPGGHSPQLEHPATIADAIAAHIDS